MIRLLASSDSPLFYLEGKEQGATLKEDNDTGVTGAIKRLGRQLFYDCDYNLMDVVTWAAQRRGQPTEGHSPLEATPRDFRTDNQKISKVFRKLSGLNKDEWSRVVEFGKKVYTIQQKAFQGSSQAGMPQINTLLDQIYNEQKTKRTDTELQEKLKAFSQRCPDSWYKLYVKNVLVSKDDMLVLFRDSVFVPS